MDSRRRRHTEYDWLGLRQIWLVAATQTHKWLAATWQNTTGGGGFVAAAPVTTPVGSSLRIENTPWFQDYVHEVNEPNNVLA